MTDSEQLGANEQGASTLACTPTSKQEVLAAILTAARQQWLFSAHKESTKMSNPLLEREMINRGISVYTRMCSPSLESKEAAKSWWRAEMDRSLDSGRCDVPVVQRPGGKTVTGPDDRVGGWRGRRRWARASARRTEVIAADSSRSSRDDVPATRWYWQRQVANARLDVVVPVVDSSCSERGWRCNEPADRRSSTSGVAHGLLVTTGLRGRDRGSAWHCRFAGGCSFSLWLSSTGKTVVKLRWQHTASVSSDGCETREKGLAAWVETAAGASRGLGHSL
jgi:hypothetical protein